MSLMLVGLPIHATYNAMFILFFYVKFFLNIHLNSVRSTRTSCSVKYLSRQNSQFFFSCYLILMLEMLRRLNSKSVEVKDRHPWVCIHT